MNKYNTNTDNGYIVINRTERRKNKNYGINKCSSDNWRSKIYKFVQSGIKAVNFIVKRKISFVYVK